MGKKGEWSELQETQFCRKARPTTETKEIRCSKNNAISFPYTFQNQQLILSKCDKKQASLIHSHKTCESRHPCQREGEMCNRLGRRKIPGRRWYIIGPQKTLYRRGRTQAQMQEQALNQPQMTVANKPAGSWAPSTAAPGALQATPTRSTQRLKTLRAHNDSGVTVLNTNSQTNWTICRQHFSISRLLIFESVHPMCCA